MNMKVKETIAGPTAMAYDENQRCLIREINHSYYLIPNYCA